MRFASGVAAVIYLLFAVACFRLIWVDEAWDLALGEGLFTLLAGAGLLWATFGRRWRALAAFAAGVPLVVWFAETPFNSGPPFLYASLVVPAAALACMAAASAKRTRAL